MEEEEEELENALDETEEVPQEEEPEEPEESPEEDDALERSVKGVTMVDVNEAIGKSEKRTILAMRQMEDRSQKQLRKLFEEYVQTVRYEKDPKFKGIVRQALETFELSPDFMKEAIRATDKRDYVNEMTRSFSSKVKDVRLDIKQMEKTVLDDYGEMKEAMREQAAKQGLTMLVDWANLIERREGLDGLLQRELDLAHQFIALKIVMYGEQVPELYVAKKGD